MRDAQRADCCCVRGARCAASMILRAARARNAALMQNMQPLFMRDANNQQRDAPCKDAALSRT
jgi:hypothetical protein